MAKIINVRVPESLCAKLEEVARATDRTKSFITVKALERYLDIESWQVRGIRDGLKEADAGRFATSEEVKGVFAKYGA